MSWRLVAARIRGVVTAITLGCAICCLGTLVFAQNAGRPEDEIFGGYAILIPNGWGELDYKINTIPNAFDASNTYYFPSLPDLGLLLDGSGHFFGGTTPPNLLNGSDDSTGVGYALGGLQYKWHKDKLSPFLRGFVGAANLSPDCCHGTEWSLAAGGGGGLDLSVKPRFSLRLIQADYIYSHYSHVIQIAQVSLRSNQIVPITHPTQWNSVRVAAGVVFNLGSYGSLPLSCTVAAAPISAEVMAGEPVTFTTAGTNFSSQHPLNYGWSTTGGKLSSGETQSTEIETTGLAPGSYSVSATITDPKLKKLNSATCSGAFVVKQPPPPVPPVVSCSVSPTTVAIGEPATITMTASSPDRRPLTYRWSATGGELKAQDSSAILTASNGDAGKTITVTGTVTDDRSLSANCNVNVKVPALEVCVKLEDWGECTFEKDLQRPWRVDNDCKDVLDQLGIRLQQMPNGKLAIVGYTEEQEVISDPTLGVRRAVNVKYYLTTDGPNKIDSGRILPQKGGIKGKATHFYFMPEGKLCGGQLELGTNVDEAQVQGQSRNSPSRGKKPGKPSPPGSPVH